MLKIQGTIISFMTIPLLRKLSFAFFLNCIVEKEGTISKFQEFKKTPHFITFGYIWTMESFTPGGVGPGAGWGRFSANMAWQLRVYS